MKRLRSVADFTSFRDALAPKSEAQTTVRVCSGTGCRAAGADEVREAFIAEIERTGIDAHVTTSGCQGLCQRGPLVAIEPQRRFGDHVASGARCQPVPRGGTVPMVGTAVIAPDQPVH